MNMLNSAIFIFVIFCVCEHSNGQVRYRPITQPRYYPGYRGPTGCQTPDGTIVDFGTVYQKAKPLTGPNGISLYAKYNCTCKSGGVSHCLGYNLPCQDLANNYFDVGQKFRTILLSQTWTCICRGGRGAFDSCVREDAGCTDVKGRTASVGSSYVIRYGERQYQCTCGRLGRYEAGSCRPYTTPTQSPTGVTCVDGRNGAAVPVGEKYVVDTRSGTLYECTCGYNSLHEPGTCTLYTSQPTRQPTRCRPECDDSADCVYTGRGRYGCVCKLGFRKFGSRCSDVDECTGYRSFGRRNRCGENAACINTRGSYRCECEEGFTGDGQTCSLMDHCTQNLDRCDINARCISSATSFQCICNDGYEGDGESCTEVDLCATQTDCDTAAECIATQNSYVCRCLNGFAGDGHTCTKMCWDEVASHFVARGFVFLRLNRRSGQQEGCTCGVGGVAVPGSCIGPDISTQAPTTTTTTTTTTEALTTSLGAVSCRKRGGRVLVGESYSRQISGREYTCTCYDKNGRGITRCRIA